jgi:hypothetical protein
MYNDDTTMKILSLMKETDKAAGKGGVKVKRVAV